MSVIWAWHGCIVLCLCFTLSVHAKSFQPTVLVSDAQKIVVELHVPEFHLDANRDSWSSTSAIHIKDYASVAEPGHPALPLLGMVFGIPQGAEPRIEILDQRVSEHTVPPLRPAPDVRSEKKSSTRLQAHKVHRTLSYEPDPHIYQTDALYPQTSVRFGRRGTLRGQLVQTVQVYPIQYNPVRETIKVRSYIKFAIHFAPQGTTSAGAAVPIPEPFETLLQLHLLNYEHAKQWRRSSAKLSRIPSPLLSDQPWLKVSIRESGLYRLTAFDLEQAGFDLQAIDPRQLQLFNQGEEVAIRVEGETDGRFDNDDVIEFYGEPFKNYYTTQNAYFLTLGSAPGKRVQQVDVAIDPNLPKSISSRYRIHIERDSLRRADFPGHTDSERWFMDELFWVQSGTQYEVSQEYPIRLPNVASSTTAPAKIVLRTQGITSNPVTPDHHSRVYINGEAVLDKKWEGRVAFLDSAMFDQSLLASGANTVTIAVPGETAAIFDWQMSDYVEIEYTREHRFDTATMELTITGGEQIVQLAKVPEVVEVYDITQPKHLGHLMNVKRSADTLEFAHTDDVKRTYLVVSQAGKRTPIMSVPDRAHLCDTAWQADVLIIAHEDFVPAVAPMVQLRQHQGYTTKVVSTEDIYNEFGHGIYSERALKQFLTFVYTHWQTPAPTYVLLVGDASWNPRQLNATNAYYGDGQRTDFVPTRLFEARVDHFEAASDNWFACVDGEEDLLPDMFVGRLPVRTVEQAEAMIAKIVNFETQDLTNENPPSGTFVADIGEGGTLAFEDSSDAWIDRFVPSPVSVERIYLSQLGMPETKTQILNAFSRGSLLLNYFGHGSVGTWSKSSILTRDDISSLNPPARLPFVLTMSCINGYFVEPSASQSALAEVLVRPEATGAIAMFSGSGEALPSPLFPMARQFYSALFEHGITACGALTTSSLFALFNHYSYYDDHIRFHMLFGDPATQLHYEPADSQKSAAGFVGTIRIGDGHPPLGSTLLAFMEDRIRVSGEVVSRKGNFGPLFISPDDSMTAITKDGVPADSVHFALVTSPQDTLSLYPPAAFLAGTIQRLQLSDLKTGIATPSVDVCYQVDARIVGVDLFDGDPISKASTIRIELTSEKPLERDDVQIHLNNRMLPSSEYEIETAPQPHKLFLVFRPHHLEDGHYELAVNLAHSKNVNHASFSFLIQSKLTLSDVVNFPNPFVDNTKFTYVIGNDRTAEVRIKIYTVAGRLIRTVESAWSRVGYNETFWDGRDASGNALANGVYFYKIIADDGEERAERVERLVVMR